MAKFTVFYSWQSDVKQNRSFIQDALEKAAKQIKASSVGIEPVIDRDTKGVAGSPDIKKVIYDKIEKDQAFVGDLTLINPRAGKKRRPTPNPNVLVELGYALKHHGDSRIIQVVNTAYGKPENLPFDLRGNSTVPFSLPEKATNKAEEKKKLVGLLRSKLEEIIQLPVKRPDMERLARVIHLNLTKRVTHGMLTLNFTLENNSDGPALRVEKWYELDGKRHPIKGAAQIAAGKSGEFTAPFKFPDPGNAPVSAKIVIAYQNKYQEPHRCEMEISWINRQSSLSEPKTLIETEAGWIEV